MINNLSIIVRRPMGDERATLGIRTAYAAQAGGYTTSLVMLGDGVYGLSGRIPDYLKKMLSMFVESEGRLACLEEDLIERGLQPAGLLFPDVETLDREALAELIEESESVNLF